MSETDMPPTGCLDCGLPYTEFPLDVILPRPQWLEIHPNEHGVLCAQCIVKRAAKVPGVTCAHLILEIAPRRAPDVHTGDDPRTDAIGEAHAALDEIASEILDIGDEGRRDAISEQVEVVRGALNVINPTILEIVQREAALDS